MPISINGSGSVTGLIPGGLPDASVQQGDLAANVAGNGPAFSVWRSGNQALSTDAIFVKLQFNTKEFDTGNAFDATTNFRFQPTVAGYYHISAAVQINSLTSTHMCLCAIYKNGVQQGSGPVGYANGSAFASTAATMTLFLNGTTDFVEAYCYPVTSNTANTALGDSRARTWMTGHMVRAA